VRTEGNGITAYGNGDTSLIGGNELSDAERDAYPVTEGHSLVIPRRHVGDGLALHQPEWNAVTKLLKLRREQLAAQDPSISGWVDSLNAREGPQLRRGSRPDRAACALAPDPTAAGGL
jgi:diadenosine tetraphosphate (Ap4A) HIT family hydrolase